MKVVVGVEVEVVDVDVEVRVVVVEAELAAHLADLGVQHREVREPVAHIHAVATAIRVLHRRRDLVDLVAVAGALVPVEGRVGRQNNCAELRRELRRFARCTPSR